MNVLIFQSFVSLKHGNGSFNTVVSDIPSLPSWLAKFLNIRYLPTLAYTQTLNMGTMLHIPFLKKVRQHAPRCLVFIWSLRSHASVWLAMKTRCGLTLCGPHVFEKIILLILELTSFCSQNALKFEEKIKNKHEQRFPDEHSDLMRQVNSN